MKFLIVALLIATYQCLQLASSQYCVPYDENIDFHGSISSSVNSVTAVAKNWWSYELSTAPVFGGTYEYRSVRAFTMSHSIAILTIMISEADCDYTVDDASTSITIYPGVNCWPTGWLTTVNGTIVGEPYRNITVDGLNQVNPEFTVSFRPGTASSGFIYVNPDTFTYINQATENSTFRWASHTITATPSFRSARANVRVPGSIVAKIIRIDMATQLNILGQVLLSESMTLLDSTLNILGVSSRMPVCAASTFNYRNANSTIANMRVTLKNFLDPGVSRSNVTVNGSVATGSILSSGWTVNGQVFTNTNLYNLTQADRLQLAANISRAPCTRLLATNGTFTTTNFTVYANEILCPDRRNPTHRRHMIFDAQGDPNAIFIVRGLQWNADMVTVTSPIVLINGAQYYNIWFVFINSFQYIATSGVVTGRYDGNILVPSLFVSQLIRHVTHYGRLWIGQDLSLTSTTLVVNGFDGATDEIDSPSAPDDSGNTGDQTEAILAAQVACATQLRSCTISGGSSYLNINPLKITSTAAVDALPLTYDVTVTRETILTTNISFTWLLPGGVVPDTQPVGSWELLSVQNGSCSDNYTATNPIYVYHARYTSTVKALYDWFTGSTYSLPATPTALYNQVRILETTGTLRFGSRELTNCTVRFSLGFFPGEPPNV
jgi:hypothetical protein